MYQHLFLRVSYISLGVAGEGVLVHRELQVLSAQMVCEHQQKKCNYAPTTVNLSTSLEKE